jgi:isoamylase
MGYKVGSPRADLSSTPATAPLPCRSAVVADPPLPGATTGPPRRARETVIYEAHVKGLTALHPGVREKGPARHLPGPVLGPVLDHLVKLGVTAIELLPVQAFIDDRFLCQRGLRTTGATRPSASSRPSRATWRAGALWEFQTMVRRFHSAGIEVILDVVYNHTGEGDELGPTLSLPGLDNRSYYRLAAGGRHYVNDTGTGNTLNLTHPMVLRMVMDSLALLGRGGHVDGFRFDLATRAGARGAASTRTAGSSMRSGRTRSWPVKLIAEPWDIGPGGYQLGAYPHPFPNGTTASATACGGSGGRCGMTPDLAKRGCRLGGPVRPFRARGDLSVNFVTAHDGFTLRIWSASPSSATRPMARTTATAIREPFRQSGRRGADRRPRDPRRARLRKRNLLATLLLSQGTPMLLAGDEIGNSQGGNNNAYAQDNETGWVDWTDADDRPDSPSSRG